MPITIREFIEYLEELPDETEVEVLVLQSSGYGGDYYTFERIDIEVNTELIDMRNNRFSKSRRVYLQLGEK